MRKRIYQLMAILMAFAMILCNNSIISLAEEIVPETEEDVYEEVLEEDAKEELTEAEEMSEVVSEEEELSSEEVAEESTKIEEEISEPSDEVVAIEELDAEGNIASGKSNNVSWVIDANGKMTISGTGDWERHKLHDYDDTPHYAPWYDCREQIKSAEVNLSDTINLSFMFYDCSNLGFLDLDKLETSNVTDMSALFAGCSSLNDLDLRNFNTTNVTDMYYMFCDCIRLKDLDLSNFNTTNVTNMESMFTWCTSLNDLDLRNFNTTNVTNMSAMFAGCSSLNDLDLSNFNTTNVTSMSSMFERCSSLKDLDLGNFDTSSVTNMQWMFYGCSSLNDLDLRNFNTTNVTSMSSMFERCSSLKDLDLRNFNTTNVTIMWYMFYGCSSLNDLDLRNFNTTNVTEMSCMFYGCSSLTKIVTPKNCSRDVDLPEGKTWKDSKGKIYTKLPSTSKTLYSDDYDPSLENQCAIEARQSYWVPQDAQLNSGSSYVRNGSKLKNGVYELAYCEGNDDDDRIWFGSWKFDKDGKIMTGKYEGVYYNESTTNGFPYGMAMDYDLAEMLKTQKPSDVFAGYDLSITFADTLPDSVALGSSIVNFTDEFWAILEADTYVWLKFINEAEFTSFDGWIDKIAENYMNDEKTCRKMLKKLVEEKFDTNSDFNKFLDDTSKGAKTANTYVKAIDKPLKKALSAELKADKAEYQKQAKKGKIDSKKFPKDYQKVLKGASAEDLLTDAYIVENIFSTYKMATKDMNDFLAVFKDYTEVIAYLENIKKNAPKNGPLYKAADQLINEYENTYLRFWAESLLDGINATNGWSKVLNGSKIFDTPLPNITGYVKEDFEGYVFTLVDLSGTQFGAFQKLFDIVEDNTPSLKATESIITSVGLRTNAISALRNVEGKIDKNGITPELMQEYMDTFDMAKILTANQYKDMSTYYSTRTGNSLNEKGLYDLCDFAKAERKKILDMGYASYNSLAEPRPTARIEYVGDGKNVRIFLYTEYVVNDWAYVNGERYFADANGYSKLGLCQIPINSKRVATYYFSEGDGTCSGDSYTVGAMRKGLITLDDGYTYYFDPQSGEMTINKSIELKDEVLNKLVLWDFDSNGHGTKLSTYDRMRQGNAGKKPYEVRQIINCPVDVAVYDESGIIVASIINDRVVKAGNENVNVFIDEDGQKIIETYNNIQYKTKITATGSGTCNYSIVGCDENGDFAQKIEYDSIPISNGKIINASKENLYTEENEYILSLYDVNSNDTILPTSINSANELCKLNINYGDVEEDGYVDSGSFIKLKTSDTMNNDLFIGWYDGDDNLLSEEESFRLQVKEDMSVTAKYIEPTDGIWVFMRKTYPYTGSAVKPQIRVYNKSKLLTAGTDYTVSYKNNVNAYQVADINTPSVMDKKKAPSVTVKGKGLYKDTQTVYFSITPLDLNNADIEESTIVVKETGKKLHPVPTITYNGKKLKENKDFTVEYLDSNSTVVAANNLKQAGEYTVSINGAGNYSGTLANPISLIIVGKQDKENKILSNSAIKMSGKIPSIEYTGEEVSVESFFESGEVTLKDGKELLTYGKDYVISRYANNREVGTATVYLKGLGVKNDKTNLAYYGEKKVTFKIVSAYKMNQVTIGNLNKSYVFTGEEIEPSFTVTYKTGKGASAQVETLSEYEDYLVSFTGNINVGTASIILTGRGKYSGSKKITFKIIPMDITSDVCNAYISDSLKEGKVPFAKGGSKPKVVAELANGTVLNENSDYTLAYANNKKLCSDINSSKAPTVTVKGKGNYKGKKSIKFMIGNSELSQCRIEIPDKLYSEKAGAFMSVPKLYDSDGKLLKAGTDYSKEFKYSLDSNFENVLNKEDTLTFVDGQVSRTIYVLVSGINNYADSTLVSTYRVTAKDLSKANISFTYDDPSGKKNYVYTGEEITPGTGLYVGQMKVTLTTGSGKNKETVTLSEDDYSIVEYENNVKCGKATVTIKGQGAYGNTKTATFNIGSKSIKGLSLEKIMSRLLKLFENRQ